MLLPPSVLVIANELALRVCRQRGLARAAEAKENGRVAVRADVGGSMHGHDTLERKVVVHGGEHAFLDLAAVEGAADQRQALAKVDGDEGRGARAVRLWVGKHAGHVDDGELRVMFGQLLVLWADQHRTHKQCMHGRLRDDAHLHAMLGIRAAVAVAHVGLAALHKRRRLHVQIVKAFLGHGLVDRAPADLVLAAGLLHNVLVLGGAALIEKVKKRRMEWKERKRINQRKRKRDRKKGRKERKERKERKKVKKNNKERKAERKKVKKNNKEKQQGKNKKKKEKKKENNKTLSLSHQCACR